MASARSGERKKRSRGQRETTRWSSFADSGVNSDTRPITGHDLRKETLPKLQSRESRRGSVLPLPIMGTSLESNSRYARPHHVFLMQRAHYLPIHGMSEQWCGVIPKLSFCHISHFLLYNVIRKALLDHCGPAGGRQSDQLSYRIFPTWTRRVVQSLFL